jgi:hypothetical protein
MNHLPSVEPFSGEQSFAQDKTLLICAEGFEDRSLAFVKSIKSKIFSEIFLLTYQPAKKSRLTELKEACNAVSKTEPIIVEYDRFHPTTFEGEFQCKIDNVLCGVEEIVIDISVMSKLMIHIILVTLRKYVGKIRIIYSEPVDYAPSKETFDKHSKALRLATGLPSYGVHDVVRTPKLTSVVMQRSPVIIIAFTSFNEQLIRALLSNLNPTHLFLINGVPPTLSWREAATQEVHADVLNDYRADNPFGADGRLVRRTSTLYYAETFELLGDIYRQYCVTNRIVLAPTGSKMQALGCALLKLCCPDIHIEYPTPETFLPEDYSSPEIKCIHQVVFTNFCVFIDNLAVESSLNG